MLGAIAGPVAAQYGTPIWQDEFDHAGLPDSTKWGYDVGGHGWGNEELQFYTRRRPENARVENGQLVIEARKEPWGQWEYTSARLVTKYRGDWKYVRVEVKALLPAGRGTWPAIWMLPTDWEYGDHGWPANGEIDVMEHVGADVGVIHASTHAKANYRLGKKQPATDTIFIPSAADSFHTYAVEWRPDRIDFFVDSVNYFTTVNPHRGWQHWPFDKRFHLLLNIAIGGVWGGIRGVDEAAFPQRMLVDYVRVYQLPVEER